MSSERYQVLSLLSTGQITNEEAEKRLVKIGEEHRRLVKVIWTAIGLAAVVALIVKFHLDDNIRSLLSTFVRYLDQLPFFHYLHTFFSRALGELL